MTRQEAERLTPAIDALWADMVADRLTDEEKLYPVIHANYFTPRPEVDEYNRGSYRYGFTWVNSQHQVFQVTRIGTFGDGTYPPVRL